MTVTLEAPPRTRQAQQPERATLARRKLPSWVAPLAVFLVARAATTLLLARVAHLRGWSFMSRLTEWDGRWFIALAQHGYADLPPGLYDAHYHKDAFTGYAFFPGYPALIDLVARLPLVTPAGAAVGISVVASVVAALGVARLGEHCADRRTGVLLTLLFGAAPMGVVLWMAYSEALFCALAAWALVGVLERRWLLAGVCAFAVGLVRPTGLVVAAVLIAAVLVRGRRDGFRAWFAALVAPLGAVGYIAWVGWRTHDLMGWFDVQRRGWGTKTDFGKATLTYLNAVLVQGQEIVDVATALLLLASAVLLVILVAQRWPWEVKLYGVLIFASVVTTAGLMHCRPRLLLVAFVLALPIAKGLAGTRPRTQWLVGAGAVFLSAWFGTFMVCIYPHSI